MADLRFDPVFGCWVAIARRRRERPMEFTSSQEVQQQILCPFCRGNEDETPSQVVAFGDDGEVLSGSGGRETWLTRIVPNKYPSLAESPQVAAGGPYASFDTDGTQEIVVPSPRHVSSFSELTCDEAIIAMKACQHRNRQLASNPAIKHVMIFMNCGLDAGASLGHVHLQIMASPFASPYVHRRVKLHEQYNSQHGRPLLRSLLEWEADRQVRVVEQTDHFTVICPYASRHAFQTWILPRHGTRFPELSAAPLAELGLLLRQYVGCLETVLDKPSYNILFHQAPTAEQQEVGWYVELFPRLTRAAGYELGTDVWVNPVAPETAAKRMRSNRQAAGHTGSQGT
ncbi:MAG: hypothetical protein MK108_06180 [Mariniblastus sp.]|nr:hypothetical protein [Mariniblastus sp.]